MERLPRLRPRLSGTTTQLAAEYRRRAWFLSERNLGSVAVVSWTTNARFHGRRCRRPFAGRIERGKIVVAGRKIDLSRYWHTDYYERRDGRWQVIFSHATEIIS